MPVEFTKETVQQIIRSGGTVQHGDHIHAAAMFWLVNKGIPSGEVVSFACEYTGDKRYGLAIFHTDENMQAAA